ncbi:MAG: RagB/SusD family nutrient uptake outer membrane protein [Prolixibacteraceae bacterium]
MKRLIFLISIMIVVTQSCNVLDIQPTNMISEDAVKDDPVLLDAYLTKVYNNVKFQSGSRNGNNYGGNNTERNEAYLGVVAGELNVFAAWQEPWLGAIKIIDENGAQAAMEYWRYENIRSANEILQILEEASFDEALIKQKSAEARWLRAYMYFELVKRYGGVPLITEPQSIDQPIEQLYVPRNKEKEIYDFVAAEMDELVDILPESYANGFGRPTKWAAYALKSRAMLYAGSIAKYGTVQLAGLVGIPAGEAAEYFRKAYEAAMQVINNSQHALYRENADPVANYVDLFIDDENSEVIFAEIYNLSLLKVHSWNRVSMPDEFTSGGSNHRMYLESFEKYEYRDGSSGKLDWTKLNGNTKFDLDNLVLNKDPRFLATAFYPEMPWQGSTVYFHSKTVGTIPPGSDWPSAARSRDRTGTGFMVRKRVNEAIRLPQVSEDETDWIVFRTGEMYLNAAEAAFETGDPDEAKRLINVIRDRAGMPEKETLTIEDVRNERFVELYLEEHRYWDIRRWRIAVQELNGKGFHGVDWVYYINEDKYTLKLKDGDFNQMRTFSERNYYLPIGLDRIADNPSLVENPGY